MPLMYDRTLYMKELLQTLRPGNVDFIWRIRSIEAAAIPHRHHYGRKRPLG